jgi:hypothetical protein
LYDANTNANAAYELLLKANKEITHQLNTASSKLNKAEVIFRVLQSTIAAASTDMGI